MTSTRRSFLGRAAGAGLALGAAAPALDGLAAAASHRPTRADLNALERVLRGPVLRRGSAAYARGRLVFNERWDALRPAAVARPLDERDVRALVAWSRNRDCRLVVRSGGHNYAGYSTGGADVVVCDLGSLDGRHLRADGLLLVEPAARLFDLYAALARRGRTISAGSCPTVAIGGHVLCGGMGLSARQLGLAVDNVVALRVVTADGRAVVASATSEPDLFWALRGGGAGNYGIVTQLTLRTDAAAPGSYFTASWPWARFPAALHAWSSFAPTAPRALTSLLSVRSGAAGPSFTAFGQYLGREAALLDVLAPLRAAGATIRTGSAGNLDLQRRWAGCSGLSDGQCRLAAQGGTIGRDWFAAGSDYLGGSAPLAMGEAIAGLLEGRGSRSGIILIDSYGGAISAIAPRATAFAHRQVAGAIQYLSYTDGLPSQAADAVGFVAAARRALSPYTTGGCYQGYMDPALASPQRAYYGANLPRLRAVKRAVDPDDHFSYPQSIRP